MNSSIVVSVDGNLRDGQHHDAVEKPAESAPQKPFSMKTGPYLPNRELSQPHDVSDQYSRWKFVPRPVTGAPERGGLEGQSPLRKTVFQPFTCLFSAGLSRRGRKWAGRRFKKAFLRRECLRTSPFDQEPVCLMGSRGVTWREIFHLLSLLD